MAQRPAHKPPTMGLTQAAKACGVSVSTLRRRKDQLVAAGTKITDKGWQIPIPALVSLGYLSGTTPASDTPPEKPMSPLVEPPLKPPVIPPIENPSNEVGELRVKLAEAETRAQVAEAISAERERIIQVQAAALRMLERGTSGTPTKTPAEGVPDTPSETPLDTPMTPPESPHVPDPKQSSRGIFKKLFAFGRN